MLPIPSPNFAEGLSIAETYSYFDRPVLFSCYDEANTVYLAVWADEDEDHNEETWVFTPVHPGVLEAVRAGGLELRTAFANGLDNISYIVKVDWDKQRATFRQIQSSDLRDEWLPDKGERLNIDTSLSLAKGVDDAASIHRVVSELKLLFDNPMKHTAPATLVGNILQAFQGTLDAIVHVNTSDDAKNRGRIPMSVLRQSQMQLSQTFAGSFGLRLVSSQDDDYHLGVLESALSVLSDVIGSGVEEVALRDNLQRVSPRFASRYNFLLRFLKTYSTGISLEWYAPDGATGTARLSASQASQAVDVVGRIVETFQSFITVEGQLMGLNLGSSKFDVYIDSSTRYNGKLDSEFTRSNLYTVNRSYRAVLRETVKVTSNNDEKTIYTLVSLEPLET